MVAPDQNTQPEPEPEEAVLDECGGGDVAPPMEDDVEDSDGDVLLPTEDAVPEAPVQVEYPTMEEYKARWAEKLAAHSKVQVTKPFSLATLVPTPLPALWQDCRGLSVSTTCDSICSAFSCKPHRMALRSFRPFRRSLQRGGPVATMCLPADVRISALFRNQRRAPLQSHHWRRVFSTASHTDTCVHDGFHPQQEPRQLYEEPQAS